MKILFLSYTYWPPNFGGELLIAQERLVDLAARGHQVIVFTAGAPGYPSNEIRDGIQVYRSPFIGKNKLSRIMRRFVFWFWSLWKLAFVTGVTAVHLNSLPGFETITANLYGAAAAWVAHVKKARTVYVHSLASEEGNFFTLNAWQRILFHFIDDLVCVSDGLFEAARSVYPRKVKKILYGVRSDLFTPLALSERDQIRASSEVEEAYVVFTFLGSIGKRKGFDLIAGAFSEAYAQHKNWRLWVIGPRSRLENQNVDELEVAQVTSPLSGLAGAVKYWGRMDDRGKLAEILGASDVFLFPSRKEGFGIAPVEAMSAGVPPIISRIPGVTDLANIEGETGLYIKPGDKEALKNAMLKLAENPPLRLSMGRKARQRILDRFTWQQHVNCWEQLYLGK